MSRRKKIVLSMIAVTGLVILIVLHPCREPDPPDHPVPVDVETTSPPISVPAR